MTILYRYGDNIYVNLTNRCSCSCTFCVRGKQDAVGDADSLWLDREPGFDDVRRAFGGFDMDACRELVFCGYGEPTCAFDLLKQVAAYAKSRWDLPVRVNTNGQGNLINGRDITPEFEGLADAVSVSLNAPDARSYQALVRSEFGEGAFEAMLDFTRRVRDFVPDVQMTTVATLIAPEDERRCAGICAGLGVRYRVRSWAG